MGNLECYQSSNGTWIDKDGQDCDHGYLSRVNIIVAIVLGATLLLVSGIIFTVRYVKKRRLRTTMSAENEAFNVASPRPSTSNAGLRPLSLRLDRHAGPRGMESSASYAPLYDPPDAGK